MNSERISPFWVNGYQPFSAKLKEGLEYNILFVSCVVDMFSITSSKGDIITLNTRNTDKICNAFRNISISYVEYLVL